MKKSDIVLSILTVLVILAIIFVLINDADEPVKPVYPNISAEEKTDDSEQGVSPTPAMMQKGSRFAPLPE